jgi:hypothetical protein
MGENNDIYFKRFALMYFLKGVVQTMTIVPASDGV